jgi:hypothetical protein
VLAAVNEGEKASGMDAIGPVCGGACRARPLCAQVDEHTPTC